MARQDMMKHLNARVDELAKRLKKAAVALGMPLALTIDRIYHHGRCFRVT